VESFDVVVAGLGAMGSAAADHLARRGAKVLGIDPFEVPHDVGSSGGETRLIRKAYFEHPDYVPLLARAYENWQSLEAGTGEQVLYRTGTVYVGDPDGELIRGSRLAAAEHDLPLTTVDDRALADLHPFLRRPEGYAALFEPDAGFLLCERAIDAQARRAAAHGATLLAGERVVRFASTGAGSGVEVVTERRTVAAGALVVTVGSWAPALLASLGVSLRVTRQPLFWLPAPTGFELGSVPCWAVQRPEAPGLFYGFPALPAGLAGNRGIKLAHHHPGDVADPDAPRAPATAGELAGVLGAVAPFLPDLEGPALASKVCLYTSTTDGHFVVDRHPEHPGVVFGCGFSGHGFKFASAMGEALADLALNGRTELPVGFLGLR
jgi:sarcosine oxidase